ncbi:cupin domain-containing protein [uncultured Parabacteroides sp.]|uniref:cupin domain-containing protein n=1 Tax=uncultured Parabacteroides sp. TaxID=512312 RepID=UPI00262972B8|nr:cupin domain-containing protein [uncultured Parabacteroides sp.]
MKTNLKEGMNGTSYGRFLRLMVMMSAVLLLLGSCLEGKKEQGVDTAGTLIFPADTKASPEYNTGEVYVSLLKESGNTMIAHFIFKPNSRNFWHYHPDAEQTLLVLDGEGYYQEEGGEKRVIRKGDVIVTPPNVRHWNGATPDSSIVCMTVTEHAIENHAVQLRAVTDEEYD